MAAVESTNPAAFEASQLLANSRNDRSAIAERRPELAPEQSETNSTEPATNNSSVEISPAAQAAFERESATAQQTAAENTTTTPLQSAQQLASLFEDAGGGGNQSVTSALAQLNSLAGRQSENQEPVLTATIEPQALSASETVAPAATEEPEPAAPDNAGQARAATEPETPDVSQRNPLDETGLAQA